MRWKCYFYLTFFFFFTHPAFAVESVKLKSLIMQPSADHSRFIFILSKKTYGRVQHLFHPERIVVNFAHTYKSFQIIQSKLGYTSNVRRIDSSNLSSHSTQFIFYVKNKVDWKIQFLTNSQNNLARLQLDIISLHKKSKSKQVKKNYLTPSKMRSQKIVLSPKKASITVVIDAGHGGRDYGAIGKKGISEKEVVLTIAKKLERIIGKQSHMRVIMTRHGDYFVPLRHRLKLARRKDADLFIAIHADAFFDKNAMGASVYALSQKGATNEAARWLAQRENFSELGEIELDALQDKSTVLRSVLIDLAQTATIRNSIYLGRNLLNALDDITSLHYKRVEQAPFVVLKSPDIPSVLVEVGFITNPLEERRLASSIYQENIAKSLWMGIKKYLDSGHSGRTV